MSLGEEVIALLKQRGETVSIAESLTGGSLSKALPMLRAHHMYSLGA